MDFGDRLLSVLAVKFGIHLFKILLLKLLNAFSFGYGIHFDFLAILYFLLNFRILVLVSLGDWLNNLDLIFRHVLRQLPLGLFSCDLKIIRLLMVLVVILEELCH